MMWSVAENVKRLRFAWAFVNKQVIHTNLQILYQCNFKCKICDFWKIPDSSSAITAEQIAVVSRQLNKIAPQIISIGGGEPLLHKDIVPIVKHLAKYHFPVMICNGWYVTPELARDLFEAGIYEISISVDYADPRKHDDLRGKEGAFNRAIKALQILQNNRKYPFQRVHMISVVMEDNIEDIEKLILLCRSMGITYLVSLYSDSRGTKASRSVSLEISRHLLMLKKKYREFVSLHGYVARFSESVQSGGVGPCYAGKNLCNIDYNGNVSLCIDRLENPVGNILFDDVMEIKKRLKDTFENNTCRACWTSCRGSIESLLYGRYWLENLMDYYHMVRPVRLSNRNHGLSR